MVYGLSFVRSFWGLVLILMGFVSIIIFGFYEKTIKSPIMNMTLLQNNRILIFSSIRL